MKTVHEHEQFYYKYSTRNPIWKLTYKFCKDKFTSRTGLFKTKGPLIQTLP